ncbi:hypothetical protein A1D31_33690 [Bradyrhizobium liaoningense]|nr:hypothetical protein A1D31_33690 [Bradyrhizobium liaoningense]
MSLWPLTARAAELARMICADGSARDPSKSTLGEAMSRCSRLEALVSRKERSLQDEVSTLAAGVRAA